MVLRRMCFWFVNLMFVPFTHASNTSFSALFPTTVSTTTEKTDTDSNNDEYKTNTIVVGIVLGSITLLIITVAVVIARRDRNSQNKQPPPAHRMVYSVVLQPYSGILQNLTDSIRQYELRNIQGHDVIRMPHALQQELPTAHDLPPSYEEIDTPKMADPPPYSEVAGLS